MHLRLPVGKSAGGQKPRSPPTGAFLRRPKSRFPLHLRWRRALGDLYNAALLLDAALLSNKEPTMALDARHIPDQIQGFLTTGRIVRAAAPALDATAAALQAAFDRD